MPRMIDLVRKSQLSSNMMQAAARGALMVQSGEMLEILVHLALHNRVFGEQARMTLAGWDEKACQQVASDPATSKEVLDYLVSSRNVRTVLLPALLNNAAIPEEKWMELAATGSRSVIEAMLTNPRVKNSPELREALRSNPRSRPNDFEEIHPPAAPVKAVDQTISQTVPVAEVKPSPDQPAPAEASAASAQAAAESAPEPQGDSEAVAEEALAQALEQFLEEHSTELEVESNKPFQPLGGIHEDLPAETASPDHAPSTDASAAEAGSVETGAAHAATAQAVTSAAAKHAKRPAPPQEERRDSTLQKIAKLDIKGRIALAMRGGKEERSILIRDSTKLVALAVIDSPKITDGEVEAFALQKNVLEAVLRAIPMKRRFAKNYAVTRNLVYNPRTPLDLSLGLMKNLLIHDLKNLSANKEVSDTIRKLALRMFKQKVEKKD